MTVSLEKIKRLQKRVIHKTKNFLAPKANVDLESSEQDKINYAKSVMNNGKLPTKLSITLGAAPATIPVYSVHNLLKSRKRRLGWI